CSSVGDCRCADRGRDRAHRTHDSLTTMGQWVDIPAQRLYVILVNELTAGEFEALDKDGQTLKEPHHQYSDAALIRRVRDGKLFRLARTYLGGKVAFYSTSCACVVLEPV